MKVSGFLSEYHPTRRVLQPQLLQGTNRKLLETWENAQQTGANIDSHDHNGACFMIFD